MNDDAALVSTLVSLPRTVKLGPKLEDLRSSDHGTPQAWRLEKSLNRSIFHKEVARSKAAIGCVDTAVAWRVCQQWLLTGLRSVVVRVWVLGRAAKTSLRRDAGRPVLLMVSGVCQFTSSTIGSKLGTQDRR